MYSVPEAKAPTGRLWKVFAAAAFVLVVPLFLLRACRHSRFPDAGDDGYISVKARELGNDAKRVEEFVAGLRPENYPGEMRGAVGTFWAGAGNDADRAMLRRALLEKCGVTQGAGDSKPGAQQNQTIRLRLGSGDSWIEETFPIASLATTQIVIDYDKAGAGVGFASVGWDGTRRDEGARLPVARLKRLDLIVEAHSQAGTATRTRELWTREFGGVPARFNPENIYSLIVTAGTIPEWVRARETERTRKWPDRVAALHRRVAFSFLARSDAFAQKLAAGLGVKATFDSPRVAIVSSERDEDRVIVSLDLRKNDMHVDAAPEARIAFNSVRSLYDGALESAALEEVTGAAATSAHDLFANAFTGGGATLSERTGRLEASLARLLVEGPVGSSLQLRLPGSGSPGVDVTKTADGLRAITVGARETEGVRIKDAADLERGVPEIAALLSSPLAGRVNVPSPSPLTIDFFGTTVDRWYKNARLFYLYGAESRLEFEKQYTAFDPALEISSVDYYDELTEKWKEKPSIGTAYVAKEDLENADTFTTWHMHFTPDPCGYTCDMISRKAYRELHEKGSAVLKVIGTNDEQLDPMRFFIVDRRAVTLSVNGTPTKFPAFQIYGAYESAHPRAPAKGARLVDLKDSAGLSVNYHVVLDDPDYPFFIPDNGFVQTSVTGRVTDAETGQGIDRATVTIVQPGVSATSWPGGTVALPLFRLPFAEFDVQVQAEGYEPFSTRLDFRDTSVFPLKLALKPLRHQEPFLFVTAHSLAELDGAPLEEHSKALIRSALAERPGLVAVVPRFAVAGDAGPVDAWMEVDPATGEIYGRLQDGLYGASSGAGWNLSNVQKPFQMQRKVINYFFGRIASWYLFAAGALDSVQKAMDNPRMSLKEMHRNAIGAAREMAKMYDSWVLKVPGNPLTDDSFQKGLKDGLDWAEKFYGEAWKD